MAASLDRELYLGSPKKVALHPAFSYAWSQGLQHIISLPPCPLITRTFSDIATAQWPRPGNPQIAILLPSSWPIFKFGQFSMLLMVIYFMSGSGSRSHTVLSRLFRLLQFRTVHLSLSFATLNSFLKCSNQLCSRSVHLWPHNKIQVVNLGLK